MSKFDDAIEACKKQMEAQSISCDETLLHAIAKGLGPSIYNKDANLVAASDAGEMKTIKEKFIAGKLGVSDEGKQDEAIQYAVDAIGKSNRSKLRPVFYYLIVKKLGKSSVYSA